MFDKTQVLPFPVYQQNYFTSATQNRIEIKLSVTVNKPNGTSEMINFYQHSKHFTNFKRTCKLDKSTRGNVHTIRNFCFKHFSSHRPLRLSYKFPKLLRNVCSFSRIFFFLFGNFYFSIDYITNILLG